MRVLILGGYGFFGARIAESLSRDPAVEVLVAGRDAERARAMTRSLGLPDSAGIALDAAGADFRRRLDGLRPDVLVHTAGPFQGQDYTVARACVEVGCRYIDLGDGRAFVTGIRELDAGARRRAVSIISGASSVPALSSAVIARFAPEFRSLAGVSMAIASGARVPGIATVRGIFGYAGKPFRTWEDGRWTTSHGWLGLYRHRFPEPLGSRWLCRVDVPDLDLLPERYPGLRTVTFDAGFASAPGHWLVTGLAILVRYGVLRSALPFAGPLNTLSRRIERLVSHRGGMFVTLQGLDRTGAPKTVTWNLLAARNHGPYIPCGAAIALVRKMAGGWAPPAGAMPCVGLLTVDEYLAPLRQLDIREVIE